MALALDATVGGIDANSYVSLAEAELYFAARIFSQAWTSITDRNVKNQALITACRRLEREQFAGYKATESQRLQWPMFAPYGDPYDPNTLTAVLNGTAIPEEVIEAQCELAIAMLTLGTDPAAPDGLSRFSSLALPGGLSLTMRDDNATFNDNLPAAVNRALSRFRAETNGIHIGRN